MSKILIAGARSRLGVAVCHQLRSAGHHVVGLGRTPGLDPQFDATFVADAAHDDLSAALSGVQQVFSCLGAPVAPQWLGGRTSYFEVDTRCNLRLIEAAEKAGVRDFCYVSVAGHETLAHLAYVAAHEQVVAALRASSMRHAVLRPTGFFGAFEFMLELARRGPVPLFGKAEVETNPISEIDLARQCVLALEQPDFDFGERDIGGPQVMTRRAIAELACSVQGLAPRIRVVPSLSLRIASTLLTPLHRRLSQILAFYATIAERDCTAPCHGRVQLADHFTDHLATGHAGQAPGKA